MATKAKKSTTNTSSKKKMSKKQPTQKKATAKKTTKKGATHSSKATKSSTRTIDISAEERWRMIATAAYLKAEARNFAPGHETDDWLQAEKEVDALIKRKK